MISFHFHFGVRYPTIMIVPYSQNCMKNNVFNEYDNINF